MIELQVDKVIGYYFIFFSSCMLLLIACKKNLLFMYGPWYFIRGSGYTD